MFALPWTRLAARTCHTQTRWVMTGWPYPPTLSWPPREGLDTGDLVLFDRPCLKMGGFFGAAVCAAAKIMGGSPFDHVGVVVRKKHIRSRRRPSDGE